MANKEKQTALNHRNGVRKREQFFSKEANEKYLAMQKMSLQEKVDLILKHYVIGHTSYDSEGCMITLFSKKEYFANHNNAVQNGVYAGKTFQEAINNIIEGEGFLLIGN